MKDLLSQEHYCFKIHTLLMKSSAYPYPPTLDNTTYIYGLPSYFYEKVFIPPFYDFSKIPTFL